jgi:hypothetical protein
VGSDLLAALRAEGVEAVCQALPSWLNQVTTGGSGDDVTLGLLYRPDALQSPETPASPLDPGSKAIVVTSSHPSSIKLYEDPNIEERQTPDGDSSPSRLDKQI